ncbi:DUF4345 family protein [Gimesia sp.]|uniref:DUF4345 family protein n=1 Tax=Gimesia sp. TaxID=2024833 RepID=UPI003A8E9E29
MARFFLAIVGLVYLLLALWCSVDPASTSRSVGFTLQPGSGQSEFLVIYGGLELALGIIFLWPLWQREVTRYALVACVIIHGCLVLFRSIGFFVFTGIGSTTYSLGVGEWLIFLISLGFYLVQRTSRCGERSE